jgi:signal transduction histidine kinase
MMMNPDGPNILLIEDDEIQQLNVQRAFQKAGLKELLHIAGDGAEALEFLRNGENPFAHMVLLDIHMPRMDGLAFLREVRADPALKPLVVVVLSTSDESKDRQEAQALNVAGYLLKSMNFNVFVEQLKVIKEYWGMMAVPVPRGPVGAAPKALSERAQTDQSLRSERINNDKEADAHRERVHASADGLVVRAREQADAILGSARSRADLLDGSGAAGRLDGRIQEDAVLKGERAAADALLLQERLEQSQALATLLPMERGITDRLLLTERARSDNALANRDDFLGMVSHDLRSLLSGIVVNAGAVAGEASATEEGKRTAEGMERIQRYAARMNRLISDLVDVVSIDAGKLSMVPSRLDVAALVAEALDAFSQSATVKGIALDPARPSAALLADFDHQRLLQVLANLLTNAIKFTPAGGKISVRAEQLPLQLQISVTDNGPGIAADMIDSVFERFWQVGKNDHRGLGLGLYISRCIVEAHGGKIWAESTLGRGTAFHFTIPRPAGAAAMIG